MVPLIEIIHLRRALTSTVAVITTVDLHFPLRVSVLFGHFLVSLQSNTTDHYPKQLPLAKEEQLRPPSSPSVTAIAARHIAIPGGNFTKF